MRTLLSSYFGCVFVILLLLQFPYNVSSQIVPIRQQGDEKLTTFLRENKELRSVYDCSFSGSLLEIPRLVEDDLSTAFPDYRFQIAEMNLMTDLPPKRTPLIVLTNKKSGEVVAFVWAVSWAMPSRSLEKLLEGGTMGSFDDAAAKAIAFAKLMAITGSVKVGKERRTKRFVEVELLMGATIFRRLRMEIRRDRTLGKFTIRKQNGTPIKLPFLMKAL